MSSIAERLEDAFPHHLAEPLAADASDDLAAPVTPIDTA
jgi:hypothetical protein